MINKMKSFFKKKQTIDCKREENKPTLKIGNRFYSKYFKDYGTVVKVINATHWYFKLDSNGMTYRSSTRMEYLTWITTER